MPESSDGLQWHRLNTPQTRFEPTKSQSRVEPPPGLAQTSLLKPTFGSIRLCSQKKFLFEKNECCETVHMDSGWLRVARGGSGADAPPLAARPTVCRVVVRTRFDWVRSITSHCRNFFVIFQIGDSFFHLYHIFSLILFIIFLSSPFCSAVFLILVFFSFFLIPNFLTFIEIFSSIFFYIFWNFWSHSYFLCPSHALPMRFISILSLFFPNFQFEP